ncbi:MAG: hypothetical protein IT577_00775 [Verrucomicrobiae bacterium]|nr:hypothetical protein [Verrucomicrobiae bacterium]
MQEPDLLRIFARPTHDEGIEYLVSGSVGCVYYSEPRLTLDIDFALAVGDEELCRLTEIFRFDEFYCPPADVIVGENRRECRGHFNVIHIPTGLKADFYPSGADPFFRWAWANRRRGDYPHGPIWYAPPEYILVWKVVYYSEGRSEKHVRDIRRMIEVSGHAIDSAVVEAELSRRGLAEVYRKMTSGTGDG